MRELAGADVAARLWLDEVVSFDGTRLRCWTIGRGAPVLVVNPAAIHPKAWLGVASRLDGVRSFVTWEPRGMWGSEVPADGSTVTIPAHGRDLRAVAGAMGLMRAPTIGYCAGALSVCEALRDDGFAPERLMFISAPLKHSAAEAGFATFMSRLRDRPRGWTALASVCRGFTPPELRDTLDPLLQDQQQVMRFLRALQSCYEHDADMSFARRCPLCLVVAEGDNVTIRDSNVGYLRERGHADDRLVEVPGSHYFVIHRVDLAAGLIGDWCDTDAGGCSAARPDAPARRTAREEAH